MFRIFRSTPAGRILLVSGILVLVFVYRYFNPLDLLFPQCPVYKISGMYCPGCGSQRALHAFLNGNLASAFRQNLLATLCYFAFLAEMLLMLAGRLKWRPSIWLKQTRYAALIILVAVLAFTFFRNIPIYPFTKLAPFH